MVRRRSADTTPYDEEPPITVGYLRRWHRPTPAVQATVGIRREQSLAVSRKLQPDLRVTMVQSGQFAPRGHTPQFHGAVLARARQGTAVRREGQLHRRFSMPGKRSQQRACRSVPELDGVATVRGGKNLAVW